MNIIFYRYGSIYEPDMISAFKKTGLSVVEIYPGVTHSDSDACDIVKTLEKNIINYSPLFVFGINFYPVIAEVCYIYKTLYIAQTVDSPVLTLFSESVLRSTNRIFMFDKEQYEYFYPYNRHNIHHLPLASATERFDKVISTITNADKASFGSDISFVGSTYREKDPLASLELTDYTKGYVEALTEICLKTYGYYPVRDALDNGVISDIKTAAGSGFPVLDKEICNMDAYIVSQEYIGSHIAVTERRKTLNTLAKHFKVDIYTQSDASDLENVRIRDAVSTLVEMPKVFHLSRINLNMTLRSIESGLPLRCFDILGCGGFLMTNYQTELEDMFVIGKDLEAYSCLDELIEKCSYYLTHEEERASIAKSGYEKVCRYHTHMHRMKEMLSVVM